MSDTPPDNPPPRSPLDFSSVREFNDRTTLWLFEDPRNLRDLLRIHSPELVEHLDFERAERINRSFIPADLQKKESDLIFRVPFRVQSEERTDAEPPLLWIYLLLEHQSRPDATMTLRLLSYMLELWELQEREWKDRNVPAAQRRLTPVVPFVFYTGRRKWKTPLQFRDMFAIPPGFERFIPSWETLFLNLHRTPPETLTSLVTAIGWALRGMQAEKAPYAEIERTLRDAMAGLEGLSEEQFGQWLRIMQYLWLLVQHRRKPPEDSPLSDLLREQTGQSKFFARKETQSMYSLADELIDKGRAEGREEGAKMSLRSFLQQLLTQRFGHLPEAVTKALDAADLDTLNEWGLAAASATTLAEVGIESARPERPKKSGNRI